MKANGIMKANRGWFSIRRGILIIGCDGIDLTQVEAIDGTQFDEDSDEEGNYNSIEFSMKSGETYSVRHKYYAKFWELEIAELLEAWTMSRKTK